MKYNPTVHHRRSIRVKDYDYSRAGTYFLTMCLQSKRCLFGNVVNGEMMLNDAGKLVQHIWNNLPKRFLSIKLDKYVIMPNHMHGIIICRGEPCVRPEPCVYPKSFIYSEIANEGNLDEYKPSDKHKDQGEHKVRPYGTMDNSIGRIVQAFKSITTHEYTIGVKTCGWIPFHGKLWQRNYYEHIVRTEDTLNKIREYIQYNPLRWHLDRENPEKVGTDALEDEIFKHDTKNDADI